MGQSLQRMEKKLKTVILVILYFIVSRPHLHFNLLAFLHFFCILVLKRIFRSPLRIYFHSCAVFFSFVKVPISPKYFFRLNKSLHLFETHCAFVPLLNPNIDLLQAVKVMTSGHHLSHDRASKGYGSTPCLTSQTSLHACYKDLIRCKSVRDIKQGIDPCPLLARSCER